MKADTEAHSLALRFRARAMAVRLLFCLVFISFSAAGFAAEQNLPERIQERYEQGVATLAKIPGMTNYAVGELRGPQMTDFSLDSPEAIEREIQKGIRDLEWVLKEGYAPEGLYYFLGSAYAGLLQWEDAVSHFESSIQKDTHVESAYTNLLAILWDQQRFDKTATVLELYAQTFPEKKAPYHFLKGVDAQRRGEKNNALAAFETAVAADPEMIEARIALGTILLDFERNAEAEEHFEIVMEQFPQMKPLIDQIKAQRQDSGSP